MFLSQLIFVPYQINTLEIKVLVIRRRQVLESLESSISTLIHT